MVENGSRQLPCFFLWRKNPAKKTPPPGIHPYALGKINYTSTADVENEMKFDEIRRDGLGGFLLAS